MYLCIWGTFHWFNVTHQGTKVNQAVRQLLRCMRPHKSVHSSKLHTAAAYQGWTGKWIPYLPVPFLPACYPPLPCSSQLFGLPQGISFPLLITAWWAGSHISGLLVGKKKDTRSSWFWEQELTSAGKGCSLSGTLPCFAQHLTHTELNTGLPTELSKLWARQCFPSPSPGNLLHLFHREQIKWAIRNSPK